MGLINDHVTLLYYKSDHVTYLLDHVTYLLVHVTYLLDHVTYTCWISSSVLPRNCSQAASNISSF